MRVSNKWVKQSDLHQTDVSFTCTFVKENRTHTSYAPVNSRQLRERLVHSGYDAPPSSATARGLLVDEGGLRGASSNDTPASAATAGRFVVLGEVRLGLGDRIDVEAVHCEFGLWT